MDKKSVRVRTGQSIKDFIQLGSKMRNVGVLNVNIRKFTNNEVHIDILKKYYQLLVDTNFLGGEAYDVMVLRIPHKKVLEKYPDVVGSYLPNIVYKEAKRVFREIGCDPYQVIREGGITDEDGKELTKLLHKKILEYGKRGDLKYIDKARRHSSVGLLTDKMNLDFHKYAELDEEYIQSFSADVDFGAVARRFQILSKPYLDSLMRDIDSKLIGYFMYLLNTDEKLLTGKQRGQKQQLREVWWLDVD